MTARDERGVAGAGETRAALRRLRWRLRTRWGWWFARTFHYRGQHLVGRDVPDVAECHRTYDPSHSCAQHDGSHQHRWVWCAITNKGKHGPRWAWRCLDCGGRKCDMDCSERRHHKGPHHESTGYRMVGQ